MLTRCLSQFVLVMNLSTRNIMIESSNNQPHHTIQLHANELLEHTVKQNERIEIVVTILLNRKLKLTGYKARVTCSLLLS